MTKIEPFDHIAAMANNCELRRLDPAFPAEGETAMPYATAPDGVQLYFEETGSGTLIIFVHESAADYASWEPQMRYFSRKNRCITYSARGYTPSHVPEPAADYSFAHFRDDAVAVLDHLEIPAAHFAGLSMGAYTSLQVGLHRIGCRR
jgi:3-oxoadipate enol-lactonase